ncbi:hypothetical protein [Actinokineospora cianjurensis]|uniref:Uncharacterized protein n=1 Tax=Actinokineospora cianjurensis TaxID=585224 RepID=A0A421B6V9_9PSEU|nr:hypothetical protein [Actinokineospora cianjurensis]RLK60028.1 hypothetical protein CLV68_0525 [Actinokineospora cianjurensis]
MNILLQRSAAVLAELLDSYASNHPPRAIAVVGNAPMPPCAARSRAIDAADLVIRMTSFAVDPAALGTRTDVVVLHRGVIASPHTFADYTARLYLLVEPGRLHWEPEAIPDWWPADLGFVPVPNHEFTVALNDLLGFDPATPTWSTTGTMATYLATELFPEARVLLTGTSIVDTPDQTTFPHAWGDPVAVTAEHSLIAESTLLRTWESTGRIEILR